MRIAIDAGHGGEDSGAVGPTGLEESDCVLEIAAYVADFLAEKHDVIQTRTTDTFVDLGVRCDIANNADAELFISVHVNWAEKQSVTGIETLYTSEEGSNLAVEIQDALIDATDDIDRGIKERNDLYVLNGTLCPSVLVEAAFVSNPSAEEKLRTSEYCRVLGKAIATGVEDYIKRYKV